MLSLEDIVFECQGGLSTADASSSSYIQFLEARWQLAADPSGRSMIYDTFHIICVNMQEGALFFF